MKADRTPARGKSSKSVRKGMNEKQRLITTTSRKKDLVSDDPADVGKRIAGEKKKSTAEINRLWQRKRYKDAYKRQGEPAAPLRVQVERHMNRAAFFPGRCAVSAGWLEAGETVISS